jgi:hypothetical protein
MSDIQRWYLSGLPGGYEGWVVPEAAVAEARAEFTRMENAWRDAVQDAEERNFELGQRDAIAKAVAAVEGLTAGPVVAPQLLPRAAVIAAIKAVGE